MNVLSNLACSGACTSDQRYADGQTDDSQVDFHKSDVVALYRGAPTLLAPLFQENV